jgi:hypothetical protein
MSQREMLGKYSKYSPYKVKEMNRHYAADIFGLQ